MPQGNWIPPRKRKTLQLPEKQCGTFDSSRNSTQCFSTGSRLQHSNDRLCDESIESSPQEQIQATMMKVKAKELLGRKTTDRLFDESTSRQSSMNTENGEVECKYPEDTFSHRLRDESSESKRLDSWDEIQEVIESDFLISPRRYLSK